MKIKIGDWVGVAFERDKIIGYIIHDDSTRKKCTVKVTKSDSHGRTQCLNIDYDKICAHTYAGPSPDDIGSLIDLALQTRDKEWFDELIREFHSWVPAWKVLQKN
ncbi:IDEAL domain-containing protein [Sporolactobacillus shoreicorticis]|uniref:IDEAL domain-containing protein n=1 Tax=Sporolactobacillus shoreicorticis TaxID=1923877 RepID=A0ABW5S5S7_9BACL|nr:IDEAL domain-containing protein [Sporolactobacillus shoreicorticis]MCO7127796.1 IDEAL domain-containing protein [Sporolactobacillus shoreicorticis]